LVDPRLPVTHWPELVSHPSLLGEGAGSLAHWEMLAGAAIATIPDVGNGVGVSVGVGASWACVRASLFSDCAPATVTKSGVNAVARNRTSASPSRAAKP
jgi:hypothetical protein